MSALQQLLGGGEAFDFESEEAKEHEVFYTPPLVVRQFLDLVLAKHFGFTAPNYLDPSAGTGVFGVEARRQWPDATIFGVEPRDEFTPSAYDHFERGRFEDFAREHAHPPFDVVGTNPPFSLTQEFVKLARPLLRDSGVIALFLPIGWWQRGKDRYEWATKRENVWSSLWSVGGGVACKGTAKTDQRSYAWHVWEKEPPGYLRPAHWHTTPLPWLPGAARRWSITPGTE